MRRRPDAPTLVLGAAVLGWIVTFAVLVTWRHERFRSFDLDAGLYEQALWLLARGRMFDTVRGLNVLGHHANFALYLLTPISWLGGGIGTLNLLQVASLALGAFGVRRIASVRGLPPWMAAGLGATFLLHFSLGWLAWELFHPEAMAITPLLFAWSFAAERRWRPFAWCVLAALLWKEDVALAVVAMGAVLAITGHRREGLRTAAAGLGWWVICTAILQPSFLNGAVFYAQSGLYGDLGSSMREVVTNMITRPRLLLAHLTKADAFGYGARLVAGAGFLPLLAPETLLIGAPQTLANLAAASDFFWSPRYHYVALPVAALGIGTGEGVRFLRHRHRQAVVTVAGLLAAIVASVAWGVAPWSVQFREGFWPLREPAGQASREAAVALVPAGDAVCASYDLVPHLARRTRIYSFPNPWKSNNWGVPTSSLHDPSAIEWLVYSRETVGRDPLLAEVMPAFVVVMDQDGIVVARRRR